tara:strand:+ start:581 stop:862 length:282 start_codon:yes stop_codon:yes gene_type:complete
MHTWTVDEVLALRPCKYYDEPKLTSLWAGRERLGIDEVCDLDIPAEDKVWLLCRAPRHTIEPAISSIVARAAAAAAERDLQIEDFRALKEGKE